MEFAYLIKAKAKADAKSLFCWFSAKSESRGNREILNILEDAEIETGRGADYQLPVRTNLPVFDDLPEEGVLDDTWCDRYELADDGRTWQKIAAGAPNSVNIQDDHASTAGTQPTAAPGDAVGGTITIDQTTFNQRVIGAWLYGSFTKLFSGQQHEIRELQHDMDATYIQNALLALNNAKELLQVQHCFPETLFDLIDAIKSVWPVDGAAPDVGSIVTFSKEWLNARHPQSGIDNGRPYRDEVTEKWAKKSAIKRTDAGTNAGGGNKTDRSSEYEHTLDTLDKEIAMATLPMDFDIYEIPGPIYRRAKEIIANKEEPFKTWSQKLRNMPGILDFSRAAIFALIRNANPDITQMPGSLQTYINANLTESNHAGPSPELLALARHLPAENTKPLATNEPSNGAAIPPKNTESVTTERQQPEMKNLGDGMFSIDGLVGDTQQTASNEGEKPENSAEAGNVQVETNDGLQVETDAAVQKNEIADADNQDPAPASNPIAEAFSKAVAEHPNLSTLVNDDEPQNAQQNIPENIPLETETPAPDTEKQSWPEYFEPGRYEGVPNEVYHAANGISSTQVKDARISLMYFNARHVAKTIEKERSKVLDMGNLVHALALEPEKLDDEFSVEPEIPAGAFTTTATIRAFIDEHNTNLPPQLNADEIKALLEAYNVTMPAQVPLGASADETGQSYMMLPPEYQRIDEGQKQTAAAMKACIKEYNSTLPAQVKTSGSRDALLEQLAVINPDLVAQESQKPAPLKVSGTKADLIQTVKAVKPDAVFADELLDAWRDNPGNKILVTRQQLETALAIQEALLAHPTSGMLLRHPSRAVEVSYFGMDEETGLEVRVRPDLEIEIDGLRIAADLKTISMWNVKRDALRAKLHREIIERDYHLSAAMYCDVATLDQFFWIFVNKDEGYHWIAVIEASTDILDLGRLEYQKTMREIAESYDTDTWPAPVTEDYTDELNDFDLRRLEALRGQ
ncbi:exodeoxyribonuclease [Brenneria nigrifluens]|uniref:Exodeoxyribonuclease n=1 Tax=Brenneria nigrifluens DSM 30175 = ATCC 13028 TaxID=1121120 RepID=A0A2U1UUV0_9GAMM|nr:MULTISPECIES: RecE family exodeoxyribonuclease [Brenneria]PWC25433.1 exodeoxyribonuclease [Brenneria nigrifluens] [Brenneria nigrifluens DSM 30175 = ATCC 13028]QCR06927.1 exodeoxyribonuclease [Brenneria nigrifluens] [Brenneria nigrifluens DSM 30175 = ATCC 13028]